MSNRTRDKNKRARLSLQNRDIFKAQINKIIDNMGLKKENEPEVTQEEDPLKFFSQEQRKKEKEEEKKKIFTPN